MSECLEAQDDWFLFYCFYFSFRRRVEWNHCPASFFFFFDWEAPVPPSSVALPRRAPRLRVQQRGETVPSDTRPHMQKVECCKLLAGLIIPSWHAHYGALRVACQSPTVASQLVMSKGNYGMFAAGILSFICRWGHTESALWFVITFIYCRFQHGERPQCVNQLRIVMLHMFYTHTHTGEWLQENNWLHQQQQLKEKRVNAIEWEERGI